MTMALLFRLIEKLINSNKGCFWIFIICCIFKEAERLTVTKVVFEFDLPFIPKALIGKINSNKGCFWIRVKFSKLTSEPGLTVTKVVFEYV